MKDENFGRGKSEDVKNWSSVLIGIVVVTIVIAVFILFLKEYKKKSDEEKLEVIDSYLNSIMTSED